MRQQFHTDLEHLDGQLVDMTALAAMVLLISGGYRRIERITTFLVAGVTLLTVACVLMLPSLGYPVTGSNLRTGFSLDVLALPSAAIAAAFGAFGITGVGASGDWALGVERILRLEPAPAAGSSVRGEVTK